MPSVEQFNEYCWGKSIAVVGEAESMIGLGNGAAIDSHDIVVRFSTSAYPRGAYLSDTGQKVDVWACAFNGEELMRLCWEWMYDRVEFIVWAWVNLNSALPEFDSKLVRLPSMHIINLSASIGNTWATNGLAFLAWLWCETDYGKIDVYGFDFLQSGCWSAPLLLNMITGEYKGGPYRGNNSGGLHGGGRHDGAKERAWIKSQNPRATTFHGVVL